MLEADCPTATAATRSIRSAQLTSRIPSSLALRHNLGQTTRARVRDQLITDDNYAARVLWSEVVGGPSHVFIHDVISHQGEQSNDVSTKRRAHGQRIST